MEKLNRSLDEVVNCIKNSKEYKKCIEQWYLNSLTFTTVVKIGWNKTFIGW